MTTLFSMVQRTTPASPPPSKTPHEPLRPPPIDVRLLAEQCLGNLSFAIKLLNEFEATSQERLDAIERQATNGNFGDLADLTHAMRGVVGILGADVLWDITSDLQSAAQDGDAGRINSLIPKLRHEMQRVCEYIPSVRAMV